MKSTIEYWRDRISKGGFDSVSVAGNFEKRTDDEINFLSFNISRVFENKVDISIDFGAGWGRLLQVMKSTSNRQVLVDFVDENKRMFESLGLSDNFCKFVVSPIADFTTSELADYAMTSFSLLHIIDDDEYIRSVRNIIRSVKHNGYLFIYESYNEEGELASHCSDRKRDKFLYPFMDYGAIKEREINWKSKYQPYETDFRQPIKLFIFRRGLE